MPKFSCRPGVNIFGKKKKKKNGLSKIKGSGITLTNNEKKYIRKVISSLKNRKICQKLLLKRKTT